MTTMTPSDPLTPREEDGSLAWHALLEAIENNDLSRKQIELLAMLAEEASEVIKVVCKVLRAGYEFNPHNGPETNREMLMGELKDFFSVVRILQNEGELTEIEVTPEMIQRRLRYTRYQR